MPLCTDGVETGISGTTGFKYALDITWPEYACAYPAPAGGAAVVWAAVVEGTAAAKSYWNELELAIWASCAAGGFDTAVGFGVAADVFGVAVGGFDTAVGFGVAADVFGVAVGGSDTAVDGFGVRGGGNGVDGFGTETWVGGSIASSWIFGFGTEKNEI